jgi:DNA-binding MarR family transcriptional regulator
MRHGNAAIDERRRGRDAAARGAPNLVGLVIPDEIVLGYRIWQAYHLWQRQIGRYLRAAGLTAAQYVLLVAIYYLATQNETPSQIQLANFTGVEKMMVSKHLRLLVHRGYLSRSPGMRDRRINEIRLTRAGVHVLQRAFGASAAANADFFHVVGDDWKKLNALLRKLIHRHTR